jgi:hypothetical protein
MSSYWWIDLLGWTALFAMNVYYLVKIEKLLSRRVDRHEEEFHGRKPDDAA